MAAADSNWHEEAFFGIHYDLHAGARDTELGRRLTAEHLRRRLERVRPDWIQCDCKGHAGYTSWPTEVGSTSPGVVADALRIHRQVTAEMGIKLGMHYSGVWDSRAIELHEDWARRDETEQPDPDMTCRLSGYPQQLMIPQMIELIDKYDVDGFWVDGENWASKPCWCKRCRAEFARRTGIHEIPSAPDQPGWEKWLAFHRDLFIEHVEAYVRAAHARKADCLLCSNWMYTARQPEPVRAPVDYLSGDFDHAWGANRAALEGRVMDARAMSWDLMAWAKTKTGPHRGDPPWAFKTVTHLCQEVAEALALGGAVMVYENPERSGHLTDWHNEIIAEVADFCRARQAVCFRSKTVPQAAVLHLAGHYYSCNEPLFNYGQAVQPVEGALHGLLETHRPTDVLTEDAALERIAQYKLAVVPEQTRMGPTLTEALERFARSGGHVLLSGAHLAAECPALVGAQPKGQPTDARTHLPVGDQAVEVSGPWQAVTPDRGTEVLTFRLTQQDPQENATDQAAVTRRPVGEGSVVAIHGPVFRDYGGAHYPRLRRWIATLVEALGIDWAVTVQAPARLEVVLRRKQGRLCVNLVNRGAAETLSPSRVIVEELLPVENVVLRVSRESPPKSVSLVPSDQAVQWSHDDGLLTVSVPRVEIHEVVVIE